MALSGVELNLPGPGWKCSPRNCSEFHLAPAPRMECRPSRAPLVRHPAASTFACRSMPAKIFSLMRAGKPSGKASPTFRSAAGT